MKYYKYYLTLLLLAFIAFSCDKKEEGYIFPDTATISVKVQLSANKEQDSVVRCSKPDGTVVGDYPIVNSESSLTTGVTVIIMNAEFLSLNGSSFTFSYLGKAPVLVVKEVGSIATVELGKTYELSE